MFRRSFSLLHQQQKHPSCSTSILRLCKLSTTLSSLQLSSIYHHNNSTQLFSSSSLLTYYPLQFCSFRYCSSSNTAADAGEKEQEQEDQQQQKGDYYRIETLQDATPPAHVIEWRSARGSGPGGQAVNTSQNKAELRVNLQKWHMDDPLILDPETYQKVERDHAKRITKDGILILTSHAHRSLEKNKEECLNVVKKIVRDASYVPPALNPTMKFDPNYVKRVVMPKKRMKSNFNKMKRQVRSGKF